MTLVFDKREELQGGPGFHTLMAGVSAYSHLPGGNGLLAPNSFGMEQLSSPALSAYKVYRWLLEHQKYLPLPLATCRLLLSPSDDEVNAEPQINGLAEPCTRQGFTREARDWRADAASHKDNITLFYFAGHGVQTSKSKPVLLLEDFADPNDGLLAKTVDVNNLFNGMAPPANLQKGIARTQLYFIDACRVLPSTFKNFEQMNAPDIFEVELSGADDRQAPIFYAAVPGTKAYAIRGEQSLFSKALLNCLNGAAGKIIDEEDELGQVKWHVSTQSLNKALNIHFHELSGESSDQEFTLGGWSQGDMTILFLDGPPLVDLILEISPEDALPSTVVRITDEAGQPAPIHPDQTLPCPLKPHPYNCQLRAGNYMISAKIDPPDPRFVDRPGGIRQVLPPSFRWKRKVTP